MFIDFFGGANDAIWCHSQTLVNIGSGNGLPPVGHQAIT